MPMDSSPFEEIPSKTVGNPLFQSPGPTRQLFTDQRRSTTNAAATGRHNTSQPSYDFLAPAGTPRSVARPAASPPPAVEHHHLNKSEQVNETLRSDLNSVRYELSTLKEQRELEKIRHEQDIRALEAKLEEAGKRADTVETDKRFLFDKQKELSDKLQKAKDQATNQKQDLERQIRRLKAENAEFRELVSDKQDEIDSQDRQYKRQTDELQTRAKTLSQTNQEMREELEMKTATLQEVQNKLAAKDANLQELETELLRVKAQTGDLDTLKVLKKELSEQVKHINKLESTTRNQSAELKQLREVGKTVEILEEEKTALESKVRMMDDLRRELSESQLRISILQDERNLWSSYFQSEGLEFDSPEALARALVQERVEKIAALEKAGRTNPELEEKNGIIQELEDKLAATRTEMEKMEESMAKDSKARQRLERQRALALKEAQFLRDQLKSFQAEESIYGQGNGDEQKNQRIEELEALLEEYKKETEDLKASIKRFEGSATIGMDGAGTKRSREDDEDNERIGQLSRKNRQLQDEITKLTNSLGVLQAELTAAQHRLSSREVVSTRILELKDNPTSQEAAIKATTLAALKEENAALLEQLESRSENPSDSRVPVSTLKCLQLEMKAMEKQVAEKEKRMMRLKDIWAKKAGEFREAVFSLLGWKFDFMPNGRVKVTHMFSTRGEEQSIEFDGEKGTMKIAGGPDSLWHKEIKDQCAFWMARQSIPCLLASILIEQYEKTTRAQMI